MRTTEQERTQATNVTCGARALCGWSPPSFPANSPLKRRVDRIRLGNLATASVVVVVVGLLNIAAHLPARPALVDVGLAGLAAGGWCSLNFWRCRHAHCVITGPGWITLGVFALVEALLGHSLIAGYEQAAFMAILAVAVLFEIGWYLGHHTNAITSRPGWLSEAQMRKGKSRGFDNASSPDRLPNVGATASQSPHTRSL
jgi:hypothetical protein